MSFKLKKERDRERQRERERERERERQRERETERERETNKSRDPMNIQNGENNDIRYQGVKRKENHLIKLGVLLLQETYITTDYESQQLLEKLALRQGHFNKGAINSSGTAIIFCSDAFEIVEKEEDSIGKTS